MALPSITSKVAGSDTYNERKILADDVNQIREAIQTGAKDIKPNTVQMVGNTITADNGSNWIRRSGNTFQYHNGSAWVEPATANLLTFTAGENIAARDVVYLKVSNGKIYKASTSNSDWIGVATAAITSGASGTIYPNGSLVGGFSGLTSGTWYGLNATAGTVSAQTNPNFNSVGLAISATQVILIKRETDKETCSDVSTFTLAVSSSTASVDLSSISNKNKIEIRNIGSTDCFIDLDNSCATTDFPLVAGANIIFEDSSFNYVSAITSAGTTTLSIIVYIGNTGNKTNKEILSISATDASGNVSFTSTTTYKDIIIANAGSNEVFINFGATATTSNAQIPYLGNPLIVSTNKYQISAICNTGETTTVRILGVW